MKFLLVLALVACAHALAVPRVPNHLSAWSNFELAAETLNSHLNFTNPNKEQVNYMVLLAAVGLSADLEVFLHLKYDQNWELAIFLADIYARLYPKAVQALAKGKLALAKRKTTKLRAIIKKLCDLGVKSNVKSIAGLPPKCNEEVDNEVKKSKELLKEEALVLPLDDLSYEYLTREPEFVDAAKKNKVEEYLEHGEEKLRKLQADLVKVFRVLFGA